MGVFRAAVMRVPVLVAPSVGELESTRVRNADLMVEAIEGVMRGSTPKPRIVVFPVLQFYGAGDAAPGVNIKLVAVDLLAEPMDKGPYAPIIAACRRHNCYVATSAVEKSSRMPDRYFHTGFIMGPEGLVLRSPKTQAPSAKDISYIRDIAADYAKAFGPEAAFPVVKTPVGNLACYVEAEAEVLEHSRKLAANGADIILHVNLESDKIPWQALKQSIAYQCQVFLLTGTTSRNITAKNPMGNWHAGASTIVGPDGTILASKGGQDEGYALADVDLDAVAEARKQHARTTTPAWNLYSDLYKA
jgi:predicted amidohydrolase